MKQKKLIIVVLTAIAITIAAVVAGVYSTKHSEGIIAGARSLQFSVTITDNETTLGDYTYMAKNVGTSNMTIRIETTNTQNQSVIYIVDGAQKKAWYYSNGQWRDLSDAFNTQWTMWSLRLMEYTDNLEGWTSGDWTYINTNEEMVRVYNIVVNPSLADSLFQPV
jgi:hypothetical protein